MKFNSILTNIINDGIIFNIDPSNRASYPQNGTTVYNTIDTLITGTLSDSGMGANYLPQFSPEDGGVFDFDGIDDCIDFGQIEIGNFGLNNPFTISVWFKGENLTDSYYHTYGIINKFYSNTEPGWSLAVRGGAQNGFFFRTGYYNVVDANGNNLGRDGAGLDVAPPNHAPIVDYLYDNKWHNITVTQDKNQKAIVYIDHEYTFTSTFQYNQPNTNNFRLIVGAISQSPYPSGITQANHFLGKIGNIQIYDRALTSREVLHNYKALQPRYTSITPTPELVSSGLIFNLDASSPISYPGSGDKVYNILDPSQSGDLINQIQVKTSPSRFEFGFDGVNDSINFKEIFHPIFDSTYTISFWVNPHTFTNYQRIFAQGKQECRSIAMLEYASDGYYEIISYPQGIANGDPGWGIKVPSSEIPINTWKNITITNDGTSDTTVSNNLKVFIDGDELVTTPAILGSNFWNNYQTHFYLGGQQGINQNFDGDLANFIIYNRILEPSEILHNYNILKSRFE
jgi:hypothetical protein